MASKWIVNNNQLIIGNVKYHEDLLSPQRKRNETDGGGMWYLDRANKITYFWGVSQDFGGVSEETFQKAIDNSLISPFISETKIYFSHDSLYPLIVGRVARGELKPIIISEDTVKIEPEIVEIPKRNGIGRIACVATSSVLSSTFGKKTEQYINNGEKVRRNEPCPCKSGKKFKSCCINNK